MYPHDQALFVVRPIEDADAAAFREQPRRPPEKVVIELFGRRRLERVDLTALRIDAGHHVTDRAVLAGRVDALKDQQHAPLVLRVELLLERGQPRGQVLEDLPCPLFVRVLERRPRLAVFEPELPAVPNQKWIDDGANGTAHSVSYPSPETAASAIGTIRVAESLLLHGPTHAAPCHRRLPRAVVARRRDDAAADARTNAGATTATGHND